MEGTKCSAIGGSVPLRPLGVFWLARLQLFTGNSLNTACHAEPTRRAFNTRDVARTGTAERAHVPVLGEDSPRGLTLPLLTLA